MCDAVVALTRDGIARLAAEDDEETRCQMPLGLTHRPQVFAAAAGGIRSWIRVPAALGDKKTRDQDKTAKAGLQHLVGDRF